MKSKYGGMDVSEAQRLQAREEANTKLKRLLAEAMLDPAALKDLLAKQWRCPEAVAHLRSSFGASMCCCAGKDMSSLTSG